MARRHNMCVCVFLSLCVRVRVCMRVFVEKRIGDPAKIAVDVLSFLKWQLARSRLFL